MRFGLSVLVPAIWLTFSVSGIAEELGRLITVPMGPVASATFIHLLAESPDFPEVTQHGYRSKVALNPQSCECISTVYRPNPGNAPIYSEDNRIDCRFNYPDGAAGGLVLDLKAIPIGFYGHQWNADLPFSIKGEFAERIYERIEEVKESQPEHPYLFVEDAPVSDTIGFIESVSIAREPVQIGKDLIRIAPKAFDAINCTRSANFTDKVSAVTHKKLLKVVSSFCAFR